MKKHIFKIISVILTAVIILLLFMYFNKGEKVNTNLKSNSERVTFLNNYGYIVSPKPNTEEIKIPENFGEIYEEYNNLQISQGFDLSKYKGEECTLFSYTVLNYPDYAENVNANLIIYHGILIGCDLTLNEENGFTKALITTNPRPS